MLTSIFGEHDERTLAQLAGVDHDAERVAIMADGHAGYYMPIGGVAAYDNKVSVTGVGVDIACGNCAIRTNINESEIDADYLLDLGHKIQEEIAFGPGKVNTLPSAPRDHELFDDSRWTAVPVTHRNTLRELARNQLGTTGGGNHYVDIFADDDGWLWVGVHFGSRAFGYKVSSAFSAIAQGKAWGEKFDNDQPDLLDLRTVAGWGFWDLMELAGEYAYAGREWVCHHVIGLMGATAEFLVHNNHNFAWKEVHDGTEYIVVRKGATPAWPGQLGFIGGSMGDNAVIVRGAEGVDEYTQKLQLDAMFSTVHGAGRTMSRTKAKGRSNYGKVKGPPVVDLEATRDWLREKDVYAFGGDLDEAPDAYRRLDEVLAAQHGTVQVLQTLRPLIAVMSPSKYLPDNPFLVMA